MLDWILEEVEQEDSQFGGFKGSGTDHLLAELITTTMEQLDDNRAAVGLVSVDMAKAFNRMDHSACIEALADQGASTQTIGLVANFLRNRSMRIKMGRGIFSSSRRTPGGAPQGTKSGNILFCISTAGIERSEEQPGEEDRPSSEDGSPDCGLGLEDLGSRLSCCLLYTSPSPRDRQKSRMPSSA